MIPYVAVKSATYETETFSLRRVLWLYSNLIPKFTKIFECSKNMRVIVFVIQNSAFRRNLSPWARSRAEKLH